MNVAQIVTTCVSLLAFAVGGGALVRSASVKQALDVSRDTVGVLEEARKVEQEKCNERITALEAEVRVLRSSYVAETTKLVIDAVMVRMADIGQQLVNGQGQLLDAIATLGGTADKRRGDHVQGE